MIAIGLYVNNIQIDVDTPRESQCQCTRLLTSVSGTFCKYLNIHNFIFFILSKKKCMPLWRFNLRHAHKMKIYFASGNQNNCFILQKTKCRYRFIAIFFFILNFFTIIFCLHCICKWYFISVHVCDSILFCFNCFFFRIFLLIYLLIRVSISFYLLLF